MSKYTYGEAILNILLFDLDRHFHSPFSKMVALKANVAISCELYRLESISKLNVNRASGADSVMEYDVGNAYHIMIIIQLKHKYVVVENKKFNSNR